MKKIGFSARKTPQRAETDNGACGARFRKACKEGISCFTHTLSPFLDVRRVGDPSSHRSVVSCFVPPRFYLIIADSILRFTPFIKCRDY